MTNVMLAFLPLKGQISVLQASMYAGLSNWQRRLMGPDDVLKTASHCCCQTFIPSQMGRGFPLAIAQL